MNTFSKQPYCGHSRREVVDQCSYLSCLYPGFAFWTEKRYCFQDGVSRFFPLFAVQNSGIFSKFFSAFGQSNTQSQPGYFFRLGGKTCPKPIFFGTVFSGFTMVLSTPWKKMANTAYIKCQSVLPPILERAGTKLRYTLFMSNWSKMVN